MSAQGQEEKFRRLLISVCLGAESGPKRIQLGTSAWREKADVIRRWFGEPNPAINGHNAPFLQMMVWTAPFPGIEVCHMVVVQRTHH